MDAEVAASLCMNLWTVVLCTGATVRRDSSDEINTLLQGTQSLTTSANAESITV